MVVLGLVNVWQKREAQHIVITTPITPRVLWIRNVNGILNATMVRRTP